MTNSGNPAQSTDLPPLEKCIGVISDTHGLLRTEALEALKGVNHILHAGDIGVPEHLETLARIAPVTGHCDRIRPTAIIR